MRALAEVRALDAGGGERVPLLDEVLDRFGPRIPFNLEIKRGTRGEYPGLEAAALAAVTRARAAGAHAVLVLLRPGAGARCASSRAPRRGSRCCSRRGTPERPLERARRLGAEAVNPWRGLATPRADRGGPRRGARGLRLHRGRRADEMRAAARRSGSTACSRTSRTGCAALLASPRGRSMELVRIEDG